jgi:serine/threonine protein kinase
MVDLQPSVYGRGNHTILPTMEAIKPQYEWLESTKQLSSISQTRHGQANTLELVQKTTGPIYNRRVDPQLYVCKQIPCGNGYRARSARREYKILRQLGHPHILAYADFAYISDYKIAFLYTKYCDEGDLGVFLPGKHKAGQFTENYAWDVALQVSSALVYLHYGVTVLVDKDRGYSKFEISKRRNDSPGESKYQVYLHRDIKPENSTLCQEMYSQSLRCPVFINRLQPDHIEVQLGDFGLAKEFDDQGSHTYVGTRDYIAPVGFLI